MTEGPRTWTDYFLSLLYPNTRVTAYMHALAGRMMVCRPIDPAGADRADAALLKAWRALSSRQKRKHRKP